MTSPTIGSSLDHVIGPDGLFSVRLDDGEVRLRAVDGDTISIRDSGDRELDELFTIELGEGSASLRTNRTAPLRRHGRDRSPDLRIDLPRRTTVVIEAASADIEADGLVGDQRYRTASGDTTLRAVSGRIAIEAVSGDADVTATGEAAIKIKTVSGDLDLRAATLTSLEAGTTSGDIRIAGRLAGPGPFAIVTVSGDALLAPAGDVRIEMATLSGDLQSELGGRSEGGRGRRSLIVGSGGPLINVRSLSGDLRVVRPVPVGSSAGSAEAGAGAQAARPIGASGPAPAPSPTSVAAGVVDPPVVDPPAAESANSAIAAAYDDARLRILRSLEDGAIDVAEAGRRLEALDGDRVDPATQTERFTPGGTPDA
jgi:Toastrack DUF4097